MFRKITFKAPKNKKEHEKALVMNHEY